MDKWVNDAGCNLALHLGMYPPVQSSAAGLRETIRVAYERRAELNHLIFRAEGALMEIDPDYKAARIKETEGVL